MNRIEEKEDIFKNCPTSRWGEELSEGVSYLPSSDTQLPCDVIADTGCVYKRYKHTLCLFVVDGENVIPVTVSEQPKVKNGCKVPPEVLLFIMDNLKLLTDVANMTIDGGDFFDGIRNHNINKDRLYHGYYLNEWGVGDGLACDFCELYGVCDRLSDDLNDIEYCMCLSKGCIKDVDYKRTHGDAYFKKIE